MEMDFMGLHTKEAVAVVREEVKDAGIDAAARNSNVLWGALPHKAAAVPQFMSFNSVPEEKSTRFTLDHHMASAFHPVACPDAFEKKPSFGFAKKNHSVAVPNIQARIASYLSRPVGGNGSPATVGQEIGSFPFPNHSVSMVMGGGSFYNKVQGATSVKPHVLGGVPVTTSNFLTPVSGPLVGGYASRSNEKISSDSEQLTIFYRGAVNVFSNISPEKAQAIMFLAGTASPVTPAPTIMEAQMQAPVTSKPEPCSGLSSPISVTSHPHTQSGSGSSNPDELMTSKLAVAVALPSNQPEPITKTITSSAALLQAAAPQARKASLARFLEKRKETVTSAGPYAVCNKESEMKNGSDQGGTGNPLLCLGHENRVIASGSLQTKLEL